MLSTRQCPQWGMWLNGFGNDRDLHTGIDIQPLFSYVPPGTVRIRPFVS